MQIPILHILPGLNIGGTEMLLFRLLKGMDNEQFRHVVVSMKEEGDVGAMISEMGVPVFSMGPRRKLSWIPGIRKVARIVREHKPMIIQGWLYHGNMVATMVHWMTGKKAALMWNIQQALHDPGYETKEVRRLISLGARLSMRPDVIIYISEAGMRHHSKFGYYEDRSMVIHNGIDTGLFRPSTELRNKMRSELNINEETTAVGLIARYSPVKDLDNFIEAANLVLRDERDVVFVCAGPGLERENSELMDKISEAGLDENIVLLGVRRNIQNLLPGLDIVVLSSKSEGFGMVIGEAMACGVPCVTTDVGDTAKLIGNTGLVVEPSNPYALSAGISDYVALGPILRKRRGEMARERVVENYPLEKMIRQYEIVYRKTAINR
jgi:glycosyltransferase involved in cell wall biosynthesis